MSMKMFDLIMSISGPPVPHRGARDLRVADSCSRSDHAKAAAIAIILLLLVARASIVPYLIYTNRAEKRRMTAVDVATGTDRWQPIRRDATRRRRRGRPALSRPCSTLLLLFFLLSC